jgi:hypothetical protein
MKQGTVHHDGRSMWQRKAAHLGAARKSVLCVCVTEREREREREREEREHFYNKVPPPNLLSYESINGLTHL